MSLPVRNNITETPPDEKGTLPTLVNPYKRYRGIHVPEAIARPSCKISLSAKFLYGWLQYLANGSGQCEASHRDLAAVLGCSRRSIIRFIQELEGLGVILQTERGCKMPCLYRFTEPKWLEKSTRMQDKVTAVSPTAREVTNAAPQPTAECQPERDRVTNVAPQPTAECQPERDRVTNVAPPYKEYEKSEELNDRPVGTNTTWWNASTYTDAQIELTDGYYRIARALDPGITCRILRHFTGMDDFRAFMRDQCHAKAFARIHSWGGVLDEAGKWPPKRADLEAMERRRTELSRSNDVGPPTALPIEPPVVAEPPVHTEPAEAERPAPAPKPTCESCGGYGYTTAAHPSFPGLADYAWCGRRDCEHAERAMKRKPTLVDDANAITAKVLAKECDKAKQAPHKPDSTPRKSPLRMPADSLRPAITKNELADMQAVGALS